jgi:hypothetical protein
MLALFMWTAVGAAQTSNPSAADRLTELQRAVNVDAGLVHSSQTYLNHLERAIQTADEGGFIVDQAAQHKHDDGEPMFFTAISKDEAVAMLTTQVMLDPKVNLTDRREIQRLVEAQIRLLQQSTGKCRKTIETSRLAPAKECLAYWTSELAESKKALAKYLAAHPVTTRPANFVADRKTKWTDVEVRWPAQGRRTKQAVYFYPKFDGPVGVRYGGSTEELMPNTGGTVRLQFDWHGEKVGIQITVTGTDKEEIAVSGTGTYNYNPFLKVDDPNYRTTTHSLIWNGKGPKPAGWDDFQEKPSPPGPDLRP